MPRNCKRLIAILLIAILFTSTFAFATEPPPKRAQRRVLYNSDGDSCLWSKAGGKGPAPVSVDDVKKVIAELTYEGSRLDTILICINAQVMYFPTKVGTLRGTNSTPAERAKWALNESQRFENMKAFFDKGIDPYAILIAEAKKKGREALLTFRMNDDHGNDFLRSKFRADHPECRLSDRPYRGKGALDFARDEVREHIYQLIEEAVRRYDSDGIELDFNRFPKFFKDGTAEANIPKMTAFVGRVRKLVDEVAKQRGRYLVLAVRAPSNYGFTPPTPESARKNGCDITAWVQNGWIDFVTVSEYLYERGDLPIAQWKAAIKAVPVYGGIECAKEKVGRNLNAAEYRAAAKKLIKEGANGVYLFNFFTSREEQPPYEPPFEVLKDLGKKS